MQDRVLNPTHDMPWVIFGFHPSQHGGVLKLLFISWLLPQHVRLDSPYIVFVHRGTSHLAERTLIFELGSAGHQTAESFSLCLIFFKTCLEPKCSICHLTLWLTRGKTQSSTSSTMTKSARHDPVEHFQGKERMGRQRLVHPTQVSHWCFLPQDTPSTWQQTTQRENSYLAP